MGNRQTAVEWLENELSKIGLTHEVIGDKIQKAKAMEKQQIMDAVNATIIDDDIDAFEYFTETYE